MPLPIQYKTTVIFSPLLLHFLSEQRTRSVPFTNKPKGGTPPLTSKTPEKHRVTVE